MSDTELTISENVFEVDEELESIEALAEVEDIDEAVTEELPGTESLRVSMDATQLYLGEIGFSPLLTAEEEVFFARKALRGDAAARKRMMRLAAGKRKTPRLLSRMRPPPQMRRANIIKITQKH